MFRKFTFGTRPARPALPFRQHFGQVNSETAQGETASLLASLKVRSLFVLIWINGFDGFDQLL